MKLICIRGSSAALWRSIMSTGSMFNWCRSMSPCSKNSLAISSATCRTKSEEYVGPPRRRTAIYAARVSRGRSRRRSIDIGCLRPTPSSTPAGLRCCCRLTGQTDERTDTRPFYDVCRILCRSHNRWHICVEIKQLALCCAYFVATGTDINLPDHFLNSQNSSRENFSFQINPTSGYEKLPSCSWEYANNLLLKMIFFIFKVQWLYIYIYISIGKSDKKYLTTSLIVIAYAKN